MNTPYPGMPQLLAELAAGPTQLTVCTAKPWVYAEKLLRDHGLLEYFDFVSGPELDGSRRTKPEIIGYALGKIDARPGPHALMIGDRHYDVTGSRALGMPSVGVEWGFAPQGELDEVAPDYRASEVAELEAILLA
jgi:phosphoglycolate phosphatase